MATAYHVFRLSDIYSIVLDSEMDQPLVFANNNMNISVPDSRYCEVVPRAVRVWITKYLADAPIIFYYKRDTAGLGQNLQNVSFKNYAVYEPEESE